MKKNILFTLILFASSLLGYSQSDFYAYIKQDFSTSSGKSFYQGSLLPMTAEFHIISYDESRIIVSGNSEEEKKKKQNSLIQKNKNGGIKNDATFPILMFSVDSLAIVAPTEVVPKNVRFKDAQGIRYGVPGIVDQELLYKIDNEVVDALECFTIIPKQSVRREEDALQKLILEEFVNCGEYIEVKHKEKFNSARVALVYGDKMGTYGSLLDKIDLIEGNNGKPTAISFAFSDDSKGEYFPDFSLRIANFTLNQVGQSEQEPQEDDSWYKRNVDWVNPLAVFVLCVAAFALWCWKSKKHDKTSKESRDGNKEDNGKEAKTSDGGKDKRGNNENKKHNKQVEKKSIESKTVNDSSDGIISEGSGMLESKAYDEVLAEIKNISESIQGKAIGLEQSVSNLKTQSGILEEIKGKLVNLEGNVGSIKSLVSNTDDKKRITELSTNLTNAEKRAEQLNKDLDEANKTINERETTISTLNNIIKELEKQLNIPDSEIVKDAEPFVLFAQRLLSFISDAESKLLQEWGTIIDAETKERAGYFISCEVSNRPTKEIERWINILSTLKLKSVISDQEFVKYIKTVKEEEKVSFLAKQFMERVVRPYVSSALVLFEQFRTGKEWGYQNTASELYEGFINGVIKLCKDNGINVDYRKLYEKLDDYDMVEIYNAVPAPISGWIDTTRKEIVLYVKNYSVSSKLLNYAEKTSCVVII